MPTGIGRGGGHQVGAGAVVDINRGIGFAGARDGGDCVGGAAARADVGAGAVLDGGDEWRIGSQVCVDHLGLHWAGVARGVDHLGGVGPASGVAVGVGDGPCGGTGSNVGVTDEGGAVVRVNRELLTCTQRCAECAADQTASAGVGGVPVGGCDAGAGVFGHRGELHHLCRRLRIDMECVGTAGGAGAAIGGGFGCDVVSAVCQRVGGDGPVAAAVGGGGAQHRAAVVERDRAACNGRAGEGRRGVVGAAVVGHGAVFGCRVVIGAGDDRGGGRRGAHGQAEWVTLAALVACGVRQGEGQGVRAFGQRADGCERAGGRVISGGREDAIHIQFGRTGQAVADVQARGGVVGDGLCAEEVLAAAEVVVVGGGCARRGGRNSVYLDGVRAAGGAGVAGGIGGRGLDAVGAIGKRAGRDGPAAAGVGRACTDHGGAVVQRDRTARFGGAAEGRRGVVGAAAFGDITYHRCLVVIGARDGWDTGSKGVNGEVERCALAAFVASGIAQRVGERMGAVGQRAGRREGAGRGVISGRCEHAIDVQLGRVGQAGADVQARRAVVGDGRQAGRVGEGARVVNVGAGRTRCGGRGGVDGDSVGAAGIADITGCIGGGGGEVISAFAQDAGGDGPLAIGIGRAGANDGAAVVQRDGAARFGGAAEGGRGVVGVAAVGHNAGRGRHVIGGVGDGRGTGRGGVDREIETAAGRTGVAGSVGGGGGDGVVACRQGAGRDGPVAAVVGRDAANHSGAVVQRDGAARFCRATESGRGVVGAAVVGQGVGHRCHVVVGADDERNVGRGGVDGRTAAALGAGVASGVNDVRGHRQGAAVGRLGEAGGDVAVGHIGVVQCDGARCSAIGDDDLIADVDGSCPADLYADVGARALGGVDGAVVVGVGGDDHSGCQAVIGHTGVDGQDTRGAAVGTVAADHSIGRGLNDGGFEGVAAIGQGLRGVVPRPVGTVGRGVAAVDDGIAAVDDLDFELFCGGVEACGQLATVDECGVVGDEVTGAHAGVGRNGGDGDRRDDVDDHGQIDQHLRASGAVVIDLVGVLNGIYTHDSDLALVVPLARQTGVADHAAQTGDAVVEQCVEVQCVGVGAVDHELHLACALGGAGCGHRAIGCLRSGRKAVIAHGGGVGTTEREHVVGRHRDGRSALQGEDFDFLNGFDRLVVGQHFEVERGVGREHKRVNACAADDEAAIHKRALQGVVTGRNRVVVGQGVQHATGVGQGICTARGVSGASHRAAQRDGLRLLAARVACGIDHFGGVSPAGGVIAWVGDDPGGTARGDGGVTDEVAIAVNGQLLPCAQHSAERAADQATAAGVVGGPVGVGGPAAAVLGHGRELHRLRGHGGVHGEVPGAAGAVGVARGVGGLGGDAVGTVSQGRGDEGPVAVGVGRRGTEHGAAVVERDGAVGLSLAGQGRRGVVGAAAAGDGALDGVDIVGHAVDRRDTRLGGVDSDGVGTAGIAGIACSIGGRGGDVVGTFCQRGRRREAPVTVGIGHHGTEHGGAVVERDGAARFCLAGEGGCGVVGAAARGDVAENKGYVILYAIDDRCVRGHGIDGEMQCWARVAFVAGSVREGVTQGVRTIGQRCGRRQRAGGRVVVGGRQHAVHIQLGRVGRVGANVQARCGVVGDRRAADSTLQVTGVVGVADRRRRGGRCKGVDHECERGTLAAFVASGVREGVGERVRAVTQWRGGREHAVDVAGIHLDAIDIQAGRGAFRHRANVQARCGVVRGQCGAGGVLQGADVVDVGGRRSGGVWGEGVNREAE